MTRTLVTLILGSIFTLPIYAAATPQTGSVLREDDVVVVEGVQEHWKLVWEQVPSEVCVPRHGKDSQWYICPCDGFAFGEMGKLDLVRSRPGQPDEVFPLTPLFNGEENPGADQGLATLQKWDTTEEDLKKWMRKGPNDFDKSMAGRKVVRAMQLGDYAHDGRSEAFMLQVGSSPCGHTQNVVIGVTKAVPKLHTFSTVEHPERPLVLESNLWAAFLKSNGDVTTVRLHCMDHGSDIETQVHIYQDSAGLHAKSMSYECDDQGNPTTKLSDFSPPEDL